MGGRQFECEFDAGAGVECGDEWGCAQSVGFDGFAYGRHWNFVMSRVGHWGGTVGDRQIEERDFGGRSAYANAPVFPNRVFQITA